MRPLLRSLAIPLCITAATAVAQHLPGEEGPGPAPAAATALPALQWSLGLGVISSPRPYVGADNKVTPIPLLELRYKKLYVQGIQAGYRFVSNDDFDVDLRAGFVFAGLDPDDSEFLQGMQERNSSVEAGFVVAWKPGKYRVTGSLLTDILGNSNGQQGALDVSRTWTFNRYRWGLTPSVGAVWQSSSFVDYYIGVTPEEARPDRPAYRGRSAVNLRSSLLGFYSITTRVQLIGLVRIQRLANEISDSPIIDRDRGIFGLVGFTYRFGKAPPRPS